MTLHTCADEIVDHAVFFAVFKGQLMNLAKATVNRVPASRPSSSTNRVPPFSQIRHYMHAQVYKAVRAGARKY